MTDENRHESHERRLDNVEKKLDTLEDKIHEEFSEIKDILNEMNVSLAVFNSMQCPEPGACVTLKPKVERLERDVGILKEYKYKAEGALLGGKWTYYLIAALSGGGITAGIKYLLGG